MSWLPLLLITAWLYTDQLERWINAAGFGLLACYQLTLELARSFRRVAWTAT